MVVTSLHPPPEGHDVPEDVFGSWSPSPEPGGHRVVFVSDRSGEPRVWVHVPGEPGPRHVTGAPGRCRRVSWSPDGGWLACVADAPQGSRHEIWVVRPDGTDPRLVAGGEGLTAELGAGPWQGWTADGRLLITRIEGTHSHCTLVDPGTEEEDVIASGPLLMLLDVDRTAAHALLRVGPRGRRHLALLDRRAGTTTRLGPETGPGGGSTELGGLTPDGSAVLAVSDQERDRAAVVRFDRDDPARAEPVAERPDAEAEDVVLGPDGDLAVVLWNVHGGTSAVTILDLATGQPRDVGPLPRPVVDDCRPVGRSRLLMTAESWADPQGVWTIDLSDGVATPVSSRGGGELQASFGASTGVVDVEDLTRPHLIAVPAHDGLELSGWMYRPSGPSPWPTVVYLHGGPESQERPVYNSLFQSLVADGIAVFAANVRGSSGFGRAFVHADDRERRFDAIEDVASCARHLVTLGLTPPDRLGCMGRSYGGYLTLAALTWFPELFAVGVDVCGMADFATFYARTEPWIAEAAHAEYGHPERDADLLHALSPLHRMDRLRAPLLVVHGSHDTNVPVHEAEQVVAALRDLGVEHRYLCFEGEGHELVRTPNRVTFVRETVAWVGRHLRPGGS